MMYVITQDPKEKLELVSSVFAQAVTALSFEYDTEIFLMDRAVHAAVKGYVDGLKARSFPPLLELIEMFSDMGGRLYVCSPFAQTFGIQKGSCIPGVVDFVDAGKLVVHAKDSVVFTY